MRGVGIIAQLLSNKIHAAAKDALLSSPAFRRFAVESSQKAEELLKKVVRATEPAVTKAAEKGREAIRDFERKGSSAGRR